jgi:predicted HicB family RNase H-like nuclease
MTFRPKKPAKDVDMTQITLPMSRELYQEIQSHAARNGVSMKEFCRQAIQYAIEDIYIA